MKTMSLDNNTWELSGKEGQEFERLPTLRGKLRQISLLFNLLTKLFWKNRLKKSKMVNAVCSVMQKGNWQKCWVPDCSRTPNPALIGRMQAPTADSQKEKKMTRAPRFPQEESLRLQRKNRELSSSLLV